MNRKLELLLSRKIFPAIRVFVYNCGFRPKRGSVFFSPSLALILQFHEAKAVEAMRHAIEKAKRVN